MPPSHSPASSPQASGSAARKHTPSKSQQQATISSFFKRAAPSQPPKQTQAAAFSKKDEGQPVAPARSESIEAPQSSLPSPPPPTQPRGAKFDADCEEEEDDDEDIRLPSRKRQRVDDGLAAATNAPARHSPPKLDAFSRTERYRFSQDADTQNAEADDSLLSPEEVEEVRKRKQALHQKFVRKLGGPDCLPSLSPANSAEDELAEAEDSEGEDDSTPATAPAPARGRAGARKTPAKLTPMERQVIDIKRKHMDTILVVEVGYKFRFFGEDARIAAKELSIVCIPGKMRFDEHPSEAHLTRFASASIPVHRLHVHVKRLVAAGHKVGVVRQLETAALKAAGENRNAPFVRKLTNLYTKGTYIDDIEGDVSVAESPNTGYLLCMSETNAKGNTAQSDEKMHVGLVAVQPATGDIIYDDFEDGFMRSEIETRLLHIAPCEFLIVGDLSPATEKLVQHLSTSKMNVFGDRVRVERVGKSRTAEAEAHAHLSGFYAALVDKSKDTSRKEMAANFLDKVLNFPSIVSVCLSAMVKHMAEYGLEDVFDLTKYFQPFSARSHMLLNGNTLTNLEIYQNQTDHTVKGSLFWTLDRTRTRFGHRLLRKWVGRPLLNKKDLEERVNAVEELMSSQKVVYVERLKGLLARVRTDLEKSLIRIYYGKCTRPELLAVLQTLQTISDAFAHVQKPEDAGFSSPIISEKIAALPVIHDDVVQTLNKINAHSAKADDKYNFFREADETEDISDHKLGIASVEYQLDEHLTEIAQTLGKKKASYVTVAGIEYLIEVENSPYNLKKIPASWRKISGTKKVSRFHTPEVVRYMRERDQHREALAAACDKAFSNLLASIAIQYQGLRDCVAALATLDALLSLADIAAQPGYVKPSYTDDTRIKVEQGRHPMVEQLLLDSYVPNDIDLSHEKTRALLVTGPNMGGKSSYVRQIALIAIMGQIGSYVPAASAELGMLDAVYTRMGAFDNMLSGESTFMVELSETSDILKQASPRSLVILDELGRGTSTHDGVAIAQAVLDHMVREAKCLTLFITHYQHLSAMERAFPGGELRNVHMSFKEEEPEQGQESQQGLITFLYEVAQGTAHRSYGLNVARLANVPSDVLSLAAQKSAALETEVSKRQLFRLMREVGDIASQDGKDAPEDEAHLQSMIERFELL